MKKDKTNLPESETVERRSFLKGAAVTTAAVSGGALAANAMAAEHDDKVVAVKTGYQETDHVKAYYKLARF